MDLLPLVRKLAKRKDPNHPWIALDDMELFRSAGLYEQDYVTGKSGFNLASVLLFGKDETIKSCLPAYRTDAVLRVDNADRYDDRDDVRTNLIEAYDRLISFICKHTDDRFYLDGIQRVSVRSIIAREIVSNMLMHREYANPFPAKLTIEKSKIYTENANKVYRYGQIKADNFTPYPKIRLSQISLQISEEPTSLVQVSAIFISTRKYMQAVTLCFVRTIFSRLKYRLKRL